MAFLTWRLHMFPVKPVTTVIGRIMLKGGWLPPFYNVTCLTLFILKLTFVDILVTIRRIARFGIQRLIPPLDVTLLAVSLKMFSLEFIAGIFWRIVLKERGRPTLYVM